MAALFLNGCGKDPIFESDYYDLSVYEDDSDFYVVEMQTYDPESEYFTIIYEPDVWDIEEWPVEEAPNVVALVNKKYEDRSCYLLPGSIGLGQEPGTYVYEGVLLTTTGQATTLDVHNAAGIRLKHIVGYEVNGLPYIFEVSLPASKPDECFQDAQLVNATFQTPSMTETPEEPVAEDLVDEEEVVEETIEGEIVEGEVTVATEEPTVQ